MRSHQRIVKDFGAAALARQLSRMGVQLNPNTPQRWSERDSIPSEYWLKLVVIRATTLEELARAADRRLEATALAEDGEPFNRKDVAPVEPLLYPPLARTPQARRSALQDFLDIAGRGWRSDGRKMSRDDMHER